MELMEPIAVNVVLPSGEQVAQLMVNPEKPIMQMKTQIAGLEGVRSDLNVFDEFSMLGCLGSLVKYDRVRMYFFSFSQIHAHLSREKKLEPRVRVEVHQWPTRSYS